MALERHEDEGARELRLEGLGLFVVGGILLAAIAGAFFFGRWVERRAHGVEALETVGQGPLSQVVRRSTVDDTAGEAGFFDQPQGEQQELEPAREARSDPIPAERAPEVSTKPDPDAGGDGDYFVQVFAGRDRSAAETLVGRLQTDGYVVRIFSEREGQGLLFKVRVGGYPSKDRAQRIASSLKESGYSAWVPPLN